VTGSATFSDDFPAVNAIQSRISGGIMVKTSDGGATLANSSAGLPASDGPRISIGPVPDPSDPSRLFVGTQTLSGGTLFTTNDGGAEWSKIENGLPSSSSVTSITSIAVNPGNPSTVFAGLLLGLSDGAIFKSTDEGDSWNQVGATMNGADITNIAIDPGTP